MDKPHTARASTFTQQALIAVALGLLALAIAYFLREVGGMLLVLFAGVMLAVFLDGLTRLLCRAVPLPRRWAISITVLLLLSLFGVSLWFLGPPLASQLAQLAERIPQAIAQIHAQLLRVPWISPLMQRLPAPQQLLSISQDLMPRILGLFSTTIGALMSAFIVLFIGLYLAVNPPIYMLAARRLIPLAKRRRMDELFMAIGQALRHWLVGRFSSMIIVGLLTGLGLWAIGMPVPISLAFITGLVVFVPYIGPVLSLIPALLVAFTVSLTMVLYVVVLYAGVQFLEGYIITPMIQERAVSLPPAFLVSAQVIAGVLFGILGVVLAVPLAVMITVIVQMLYIEDVLGDRTIGVMGDDPWLDTKP
ncbi:MAG: AI-2E family transporter [Nitrococcus sp.]|nr:AI-2E family transporter [Nitrococcus sp.]